MKKIIDNRFIFFSFSFLVLLILYYPTFFGLPIWDDKYFLFEGNIKNFSSIWDTLRIFSWPVTILFQRFMLTTFEDNYFYYHLTNFFLHFANALLFYHLLKQLKINSYRWGYFIFLFHPSMLISVAWMIQFKTLLCAFFTLLAMNYFVKSQEEEKTLKKRWYKAFSFINLILSLGSKTASLPLVAHWFFSLKDNKKKKILIIPAAAVVAAALYKLLNSKIALDGIRLAIQTSSYDSTVEFIIKTIPQTISWYFWQALLPFYTVPIRGPVPNDLMTALFGLALIVLFLFFIYKQRAFRFLIGFFLMLTPFLGFIPAPFMTSTWVSDQHLYLPLIFFIPALCLLLENIPTARLKIFTQAAFLSFVLFVSFSSVDHYKDEYQFYKSSFDFNYNIAAGYQLVNYYTSHGMKKEAREIYYQILTSHSFSEVLKDDFFWLKIQHLEPEIFRD